MLKNAAKAMRITPEYGIQVGKRADLVIIDAVGVPEALRLQPDRLWVIKEGRVIAENRSSRKLLTHSKLDHVCSIDLEDLRTEE